jgi:hypothetical protein
VEKRRDSRPSTCRPRVQYREEEDMLWLGGDFI